MKMNYKAALLSVMLFCHSCSSLITSFLLFKGPISCDLVPPTFCSGVCYSYPENVKLILDQWQLYVSHFGLFESRTAVWLYYQLWWRPCPAVWSSERKRKTGQRIQKHWLLCSECFGLRTNTLQDWTCSKGHCFPITDKMVWLSLQRLSGFLLRTGRHFLYWT